MLKSLLAAAAVALALAPQALAKGPLVLCGVSACASLGTEADPSVRWWPDAYVTHVPRAVPAPFLKLRFSRYGDALGYWVPSAGLLRLSPSESPARWVQPSPEESALLMQATSGLRPFAAPNRVGVLVDFQPVERGSSTYLRLFTTGVPVATPVGAKGWLEIHMGGAETPWTDGRTSMWISRVGSFLRHGDGDVVKIVAPLADKVRRRLPLR